MYLNEQEYDRLARVAQDLRACQTENRRLRAVLQDLRDSSSPDSIVHALTAMALESGDE